MGQRIEIELGLSMPLDVGELQFEDTPVDQTIMHELATGNFLAHQCRVVLVGGTGTGKTHPAIALARASIHDSKRGVHRPLGPAARRLGVLLGHRSVGRLRIPDAGQCRFAGVPDQNGGPDRRAQTRNVSTICLPVIIAAGTNTAPPRPSRWKGGTPVGA